MVNPGFCAVKNDKNTFFAAYCSALVQGCVVDSVLFQGFVPLLDQIRIRGSVPRTKRDVKNYI